VDRVEDGVLWYVEAATSTRCAAGVTSAMRLRFLDADHLEGTHLLEPCSGYLPGTVLTLQRVHEP
jgi:hypothetical protein